MQPLISVIVPVYNGQDYLKKCIESIEEQTYGNLEIILIDDGSVDKTPDICRELEAETDRLHVIRMEDEGVSAARNAGLEAAAGELITFVDADDRLLPDTLQILYQSLVQSESDLAGCGFRTWMKEEQWQTAQESAPYEQRVYQADAYLREEVLQGNSRCWSKLYKREAIGKIRFQKGLTIGEDMLFLVELLAQNVKIAEVSYQGYAYYQNQQGVMQRAFRPGYMDQIRCWELARDRIRELAPDSEAKVTANLLMAIMLTAGKLALLSSKERQEQKQYIDICHTKVCKELQLSDAYRLLSTGYRIKTQLFARFPQFYLWLYHFHKSL